MYKLFKDRVINDLKNTFVMSHNVMDTRAREFETNKDVTSGYPKQSPCVCQAAAHSCTPNYFHPGSFKLSPNLNGDLKAPSDMYSGPSGDIHSFHRAATFPTFSPLAPTFTNINQTTNSSLQASDNIDSSTALGFKTSQLLINGGTFINIRHKNRDTIFYLNPPALY